MSPVLHPEPRNLPSHLPLCLLRLLLLLLLLVLLAAWCLWHRSPDLCLLLLLLLLPVVLPPVGRLGLALHTFPSCCPLMLLLLLLLLCCLRY
jgi:hypothetical protein